MRSIITLCMVLFIGPFLFAQIKFEKGYLIKNNGTRMEVLIKNSGRIQEEGKIYYKIAESGQTSTFNSSELREFGIGEDLKFLSREVNIIKSGNGAELDRDRDYEFSKQSILLKVLVEGEASLYFYKSNPTQFFYSVNPSEIKPLIYKKYLVENSKIEENNQFKRQLYDDLKCSQDNAQQLQEIDYNRGDLIKYFIEYNQCKRTPYRDLSKSDSKFFVNLNIRPGINLNQFDLIFGNQTGRTRQFGEKSNTGFRFGTEIEALLPFHRNKWAVFIEPTYQDFSFEGENFDLNASFDYSSIEVPVGIRHYFYINDEAKVFLNAAFSPIFLLQSEVNLEFSNEAEISTKPYLSGGVGFKFRSKYSFEFRLNSQREIFEKSEDSWYSEFNTMSLILGYTVF